MDKRAAIIVAQRYSELVTQHIPVKYIILFGSYTTDTATPNSDIDIAIVTDKLESDFLETYAKLFKLRRSVDFRIEPVLIDVNEDESGFLEEILNTGEYIYTAAS